MDHCKASVMGYRTLFEGSGIHHSNSGLQITHDIYINGYFMLFFDLTTDRAASEGHTSHPDNGIIRLDLKFIMPLPETITCIFDVQYDNSFRVDTSRKVITDFSIMNTTQILCTLKDVRSFLAVFPSDMLPRSVTQFSTDIINADPHTDKGSHWLTVHFLPKFSSAYFFDSYGIVRLVPDIAAFIRRNCTVWDYNRRQLQCVTNNI